MLDAEVTADCPSRDRPGTFLVITRRDCQVIHHTNVTALDRKRILRDPTAAHIEAWTRPVRSYR
jgi:hypothetical protein